MGKKEKVASKVLTIPFWLKKYPESIIVISFSFLSYLILSCSMDKLNLLSRKIKINEQDQDLSRLYKDLTKAINSRDFNSIWELSKVITRYHFKDLND